VKIEDGGKIQNVSLNHKNYIFCKTAYFQSCYKEKRFEEGGANKMKTAYNLGETQNFDKRQTSNFVQQS
jgi:hypothetical protein